MTPFYTTVWHRASYWRICLDRQWVSWIVPSPRVDDLGYSWANLFFPVCVFLATVFKFCLFELSRPYRFYVDEIHHLFYLNDEQFCIQNDTFMIERTLFLSGATTVVRCSIPRAVRALKLLRELFSLHSTQLIAIFKNSSTRLCGQQGFPCSYWHVARKYNFLRSRIWQVESERQLVWFRTKLLIFFFNDLFLIDIPTW